jgi:branched-chain amino acid aminotransferase
MWAFVIDQFIPEDKASLFVGDLAIQRGYGVFDFFKVLNFVPVFLNEHLDRFYFSAKEMRLKVPYSKDELKKIIFELLEKNNVRDTGVRITLTGGYSQDGYQLSSPNLIISLRSFNSPPVNELAKPIKLITYEHQRQLPHVKTIDYLMAIWLQPIVRQHNADDILYHQNGIVTECPRSNFFIVTNDDKIITPSENILKGVMRMKLLQAATLNYHVEERAVSIEEIKRAKEAFITSTTKTILPVHQVDEYIFSKENKVTTQLYKLIVQLQSKQTQNV